MEKVVTSITIAIALPKLSGTKSFGYTVRYSQKLALVNITEN